MVEWIHSRRENMLHVSRKLMSREKFLYEEKRTDPEFKRRLCSQSWMTGQIYETIRIYSLRRKTTVAQEIHVKKVYKYFNRLFINYARFFLKQEH